MRRSAVEHRTRLSFGLLWNQALEPRYPTHIARVVGVIGPQLLPAAGRVLDAGCGDGRDLAALVEARPDLQVVGMDFSEGVSVTRHRVGTAAPVVRGSVLDPPFVAGSFDLVYSYGVLHHTIDPRRAFARLAELIAPAGQVVIYVYSDLQEEPRMRAGLRAVNLLRGVTTRLPHRWLLRACRALAPVAYLVCGLPAALLRRTHRSALADRMPLNWVNGPFAATGDLYDRFSAPVESRHSPAELRAWAAAAALSDVEVLRLPGVRGWVLHARRGG